MHKEEKKRRCELREAKEALWKIRGREEVKGERKTDMEKAEDEMNLMENLLEKIEKEVERIKEEEERKRKDEEMRKNEDKKKRETKESRMRKKKQLEERWGMLRWVTNYLDENKERWEKEREKRMKEEERRLAEWDKMARFAKIRILKEKSKIEKRNNLERENENIEKCEWREKDQEDPPSVAQHSPHNNPFTFSVFQDRDDSPSVAQLSLPDRPTPVCQVEQVSPSVVQLSQDRDCSPSVARLNPPKKQTPVHQDEKVSPNVARLSHYDISGCQTQRAIEAADVQAAQVAQECGATKVTQGLKTPNIRPPKLGIKPKVTNLIERLENRSVVVKKSPLKSPRNPDGVASKLKIFEVKWTAPAGLKYLSKVKKQVTPVKSAKKILKNRTQSAQKIKKQYPSVLGIWKNDANKIPPPRPPPKEIKIAPGPAKNTRTKICNPTLPPQNMIFENFEKMTRLNSLENDKNSTVKNDDRIFELFDSCDRIEDARTNMHEANAGECSKKSEKKLQSGKKSEKKLPEKIHGEVQNTDDESTAGIANINLRTMTRTIIAPLVGST